MSDRRKKILFVIESLKVAGGERSLVTLLNELDYSRLDVDLQLMDFQGGLQKYIPPQVNVLPPLDYIEFLLGNRSGSLSMWLSRIMFSVEFRMEAQKLFYIRARKWWKTSKRHLLQLPTEYDVAIAYSQCIPTFYVVEKVKAKKKIGWVNCIFHLRGKDQQWQEQYYNALDNIVLVSQQALSHFTSVYPCFRDKMLLYSDLISAKTINYLSDEGGDPYTDEETKPRLLTVARLDDKDKGYDITLDACRILKERGIPFKWYALGEGSYRPEIEEYIKVNGLQDYFELLGTTPNPYPYIKNCTIYVQTSRHEGFGLSIAEARILNRPVVTTAFDSVYNQMVPNKNGLVVPIDSIAVADAIQRLLTDKSLYDSIVQYQRQEKKGNLEEIEKFYQLIDERTNSN